ncbi:endoplasmic reticulum-golgi intermediate compartment protein 3 [Nannochloropsis gaditana]|uniref:Endoplasmic reticulum-golgi intermediate compartment protein 3 n=1 Tax=Nannochloropsis gaditana TaxID=72520 RepID=W7TMC0_9STRA|nr:endoplasmic reticulum-golgi intermediate compartment protein 3 [Nannochloropsis gaditana]
MISPNISPKDLTLYERLRRLDYHPKTKDDFKVRTAYGGATSVVALACMIFLFFTELKYSMEKEIVDHMYVNSSRDTRLLFNFNLTFPSVSCSLLSADALDPLGNKQEGVESHVFKTRLDSMGNPIAAKTWHKLGDTFTEEDLLLKHEEDSRAQLEEEEEQEEKLGEEGDGQQVGEDGKPRGRNLKRRKCGDCYGAGEPGQCCNTCAEVKQAYDSKGWAFIGLNVEQCKQENLQVSFGDGAEEGCNIHGSLLLTHDSGNVHFAPGEQLRQSGALNVADLVTFTFLQFNVSHEIHHLSLGEEFPGFRSPLSNQKRSVADGYGMYQYYLKVVPTIYKHLSQPPTVSNQYAVSEHIRHINPGSNRGLPGVWFFYDTSPVHVEFQERRKGLLPFLTSVCAIVGGVFSVFGVVDGVVHNLMKNGLPTGKMGGAPGS